MEISLAHVLLPHQYSRTKRDKDAHAEIDAWCRPHRPAAGGHAAQQPPLQAPMFLSRLLHPGLTGEHGSAPGASDPQELSPLLPSPLVTKYHRAPQCSKTPTSQIPQYAASFSPQEQPRTARPVVALSCALPIHSVTRGSACC